MTRLSSPTLKRGQGAVDPCGGNGKGYDKMEVEKERKKEEDINQGIKEGKKEEGRLT